MIINDENTYDSYILPIQYSYYLFDYYFDEFVNKTIVIIFLCFLKYSIRLTVSSFYIRKQ